MRTHRLDSNDSRQRVSAALLRCIAGASDTEVLAAIDAADGDWNAVWEQAEEQHVQPLVAQMLLRPSLVPSLPPAVVSQAKAIRLQWAMLNMATHAELERIGRCFAEHGIAVAPLKGTSLAQRLYGDLAGRRCGDIDLLVPLEQRERASDLLADMGYRLREANRPGVKDHPFHGVPLMRVVGRVGFVVELHWNVSDPRFVPVDASQLWQHITANAEVHGGLSQLPVEALLVFLAIHFPKHDRGLLRLLADIHHLIRNEGATIDWAELIALAEQWYADDILAFVLSYARSLLETPVPEWVLERLRPSRPKQGLVRRLTGTERILYPPETEHLRISRFRLAYCAMLRPPWRAMHAYWHYVIVPPVDHDDSSSGVLVDAIRRPLSGLARTALALQASLRCR